MKQHVSRFEELGKAIFTSFNSTRENSKFNVRWNQWHLFEHFEYSQV